jgi:ribosomal protein L11 methyltransferase
MPVHSALTTIPGEDAAQALAEALETLDPAPEGVGTLMIEDGSGLWEVSGYFTEPPDLAGLALLSMIHGARDFAVSELPETDWVAKVRRELAPVRAGRFFLYGSHDADKVPDGVIALLIDAAMAFGTGHHGTTRGCLVALDKLATDGFVARSVADIGCGTAVLALAARCLWPDAGVIASDIDQVAVDTSEANADFNGMAGQIACVTAPGFDHAALHAAAPYDLIFANILKGPLIELAPDMATHAAPGAFVILSGILNEQADDVVATYAAQGFFVADRIELGEWTTLTLQNRPR